MPDDGRSISRNVASLNILVHDMINLLYYEHWTVKRKYFYVYQRWKKLQYGINRAAAKISVSSSGNKDKYDYLTAEEKLSPQ